MRFNPEAVVQVGSIPRKGGGRIGPGGPRRQGECHGSGPGGRTSRKSASSLVLSPEVKAPRPVARQRELDPWNPANLAFLSLLPEAAAAAVKKCGVEWWGVYCPAVLVSGRPPGHRWYYPRGCGRRECPGCGWRASRRRAARYVELFEEMSKSPHLRRVHASLPCLWTPTFTLPTDLHGSGEKRFTIARFSRVLARTLARFFGGSCATGWAVSFDVHHSADPVNGGRFLHAQLAGLSLVRTAPGVWEVHRGELPPDRLAALKAIYREEVSRAAGYDVGPVDVEWRFHMPGESPRWLHRLTYDARGAPVEVCDFIRAAGPAGVDPAAVAAALVPEVRGMNRSLGYLADGVRARRLKELGIIIAPGWKLGDPGECGEEEEEEGPRCPVHDVPAEPGRVLTHVSALPAGALLGGSWLPAYLETWQTNILSEAPGPPRGVVFLGPETLPPVLREGRVDPDPELSAGCAAWLERTVPKAASPEPKRRMSDVLAELAASGLGP